MDTQLPAWVVEALVLAALAYGVTTLATLRDTRKMMAKLLEMHESPDDYGFGSGAVDSKLDKIAQACDEQTHYLKWFVRTASGKEPPPPMNNVK